MSDETLEKDKITLDSLFGLSNEVKPNSENVVKETSMLEEFAAIAAANNLSPEEIALYSFDLIMQSNKKINKSIAQVESEIDGIQDSLQELSDEPIGDDYIRDKLQDELSSEWVIELIDHRIEHQISELGFDDYEFDNMVSQTDLDDSLQEYTLSDDIETKLEEFMTREKLEEILSDEISAVIKINTESDLKARLDNVSAATKAFKDKFRNMF